MIFVEIFLSFSLRIGAGWRSDGRGCVGRLQQCCAMLNTHSHTGRPGACALVIIELLLLLIFLK